MATRVIVVSGDFGFRMSVANALRGESQMNVAVSGDVFQGAAMVSLSAPNALILDTDTLRVSDTHAKSLMAPGNVLVIAVGRTNAANFIRQGIPCILSKPLADNSFSMSIFIREIRANIDKFLPASRPAAPVFGGAPAALGAAPAANKMTGEPVTARQKIIAIAASTGGTEALPVVMREIPANAPPILIVQHMPPVFTTQFADRLDRLSKVSVKEAASGDMLRKGLALLAPGDLHMVLTRTGVNLSVDCVMSEKVHAVRPAADVLFNSMLPITGGNVIGVILTGMGNDGAPGLKSLHDRGAVVIGQDEQSSVVYGMPKAAFELGAVDYQLPLDKIGQALKEFIE